MRIWSVVLFLSGIILGLSDVGETAMGNSGNLTPGGPYISDNNTILLLHFDEKKGITAADSSSYSNNGTLNNMDDSNWVAGKFGNAFSFDGIDDYVNCGNKANFKLTNAFTLEAWIFKKSNNVDTNIIDYEGWSEEKREYGYALEVLRDGRVSLVIGPGGEQQKLYSASALSINQWYHVAATFDGSTGCLYINGQLDNWMPMSSPDFTHTWPLMVGSYAGSDWFFNGVIDEVRISNVVRAWGGDYSSQPKKDIRKLNVFNPSFEVDSNNDKVPDGWGVSGTENRLKAGTDDKVAHSGTYSVKIEGTIYPEHCVCCIHLHRFPVDGSKKYRFSAWVKAKNSTSDFTVLLLTWLNDSQVGISTTESRILPAGTFDWTRIEVMSSPPSEAKYLQLELHSWNNKGAVWFDDVELAELSSTAEEYPEASLEISLTNPSDKATSVSIDTKIKVIFNEDIDKESLRGAIFGLEKIKEYVQPLREKIEFFSSTVLGKIESAQRTLVFIPEKPLKGETTYQVWIKSGQYGIRDKKGGFLKEDVQFSFSTSPEVSFEEKFPQFREFMAKVTKVKSGKVSKESPYTPYSPDKVIFSIRLETTKISEELLSRLWEDIPPELRDNFAIDLPDGAWGDCTLVQLMTLKELKDLLSYASQQNIRILFGPEVEGKRLIYPKVVDELLRDYPNIVGVALPEQTFKLYEDVIVDGKKLFDGKRGQDWKEYLEVCHKHGRVLLSLEPAFSMPGLPAMHLGFYIDNGAADYLHQFAITLKPTVKMNCHFCNVWHFADSLLHGSWLADWFDRKSSQSEFWYWEEPGYLDLGERTAVRKGDISKMPYSFWSTMWAREAIAGADFFYVETVGFGRKVITQAELESESCPWAPLGPLSYYTPNMIESIDDLYKFARFILTNKVIPTKEEMRKQTKVVLKYTEQKDFNKIRSIIESLYKKDHLVDYLCPDTRYGIIAVIPDPERFSWVNTWDAKVIDPNKLSLEEIVKIYNQSYPPIKSTAYVLRNPHALFITSPEENTETIYFAEEKIGKFEVKTEVNADRIYLFSVDKDKLSFYTHGRPGFVSELEITLPYPNSKASIFLEGVELPEGKGLYQYEKVGKDRIKVKFLHGKHSLVGVIEPLK